MACLKCSERIESRELGRGSIDVRDRREDRSGTESRNGRECKESRMCVRVEIVVERVDTVKKNRVNRE